MNIENAKNEFTKFAKQYDLTFPKMKRKFKHSFRVMENAKNIAKNLNLNNEEIEIATLIGLLHDIGHFEEIRVKDILKENTKLDHGDLGVEILQENNYLRKYIKDDKYDNIILKAIKNHNKFKIEEGLSREELAFAKIIRDADKLDIFYEGAEMFWNDEKQIEEINDSKITDKIVEMFSKNEYCDRKYIQTKVDSIIVFISAIFDINFNYDFLVLRREDYINRILDKFDFKDETTVSQMNQIRKITNEYVENMARF